MVVGFSGNFYYRNIKSKNFWENFTVKSSTTFHPPPIVCPQGAKRVKKMLRFFPGTARSLPCCTAEHVQM